MVHTMITVVFAFSKASEKDLLLEKILAMFKRNGALFVRKKTCLLIQLRAFHLLCLKLEQTLAKLIQQDSKQLKSPCKRANIDYRSLLESVALCTFIFPM
ncbi:hypothetical protein B0H99_11027 [Planomicrobium soli]|uniref:Uncharacterized protein n=1 Tax=Planomicrobium soli TaxID=1176648 RepID=A0A2P8GG24_9BACL|nr:hypothetical protein [Planomicrobium soli]PSL32918.1 hypothetical protein B0H99_11027 [Planomicrobium soli]